MTAEKSPNETVREEETKVAPLNEKEVGKESDTPTEAPATPDKVDNVSE